MSTTARTMTLVWLILVAATVGSWGLAEAHGAGRWTVFCVMLAALFKARLVFLHFMELKLAPRALRLTFEIWIIVCAGMISILQWHGQV